jgi:hypothetical protein
MLLSSQAPGWRPVDETAGELPVMTMLTFFSEQW